MSLLGAAEIRDLATELGINPTKKLGQNFLLDANTVRKIVRTSGATAGDTVVEIGPGLGSLTLGLLEVGARVIAIEIDARLSAALPNTVAKHLPDADLTVIHADAMRVHALPEAPTKLVANLPYNVSVPVLLHFMEHFPSLASGVVMVQAEVGQRLAAQPGSKIYGAPSVKAAWYGKWKIVSTVSRQVFWPVPNVDSVLVEFTRRPEPGNGLLREHTFRIVDAAFGQRRKMLRATLSSIFGSSEGANAALAQSGIDPTRRGEQLSLHDFVALAHVV